MLNQKLQLKLLQKLSPQQIQLLRLLMVPTIALEQRIKQEIEENPALEDASDEETNENEEETKDKDDTDEESTEENELQDDEFDLQDYMDDEYIPEYKLTSNNKSPDEETDQKEVPFASSISFQDSLIDQLRLRRCSEKQYQIGLYIIGNIDDSGYLKREPDAMVDDLAFSQNISTTSKEIMEMLEVIQEFDPPGIGGRNLQECLLIQLKRIEEPTDSVKTAIIILERHYDEFVKKHFDKIMANLQISEEKLKDAYNEILKLNPKPGNSLIDTTKTVQYIVPDFIVTNNNGQLDIILNSRNAPELRINRSYSEMIETLAQSNRKLKKEEKDLLFFVRQKIDSARWFIEMIRQRQITLYSTMKAIMEYQKEYFLTGDETRLRPMILRDISEMISLDVSTVSRVANSKYVQTPYGTFLLKTFFSDSMQTEAGEEISTREVKKILADCIAAEDKRKPITDDQLMKILKEKGYHLARRTIAKYRENLEIPVARLRKEL